MVGPDGQGGALFRCSGEKPTYKPMNSVSVHHPCSDTTSLLILHYLLYHRRPAAPEFLAARLEVTSMLVTHSLTKMVEKGLVRKIPFQKGGNGFQRCAITDLGEQFLAEQGEPIEMTAKLAVE